MTEHVHLEGCGTETINCLLLPVLMRALGPGLWGGQIYDKAMISMRRPLVPCKMSKNEACKITIHLTPKKPFRSLHAQHGK